MTQPEKRLAIVERRGERWVPTQLVKGDMADTLLELLSPDDPECIDERCMFAGRRHGHDKRGTWVER